VDFKDLIEVTGTLMNEEIILKQLSLLFESITEK